MSPLRTAWPERSEPESAPGVSITAGCTSPSPSLLRWSVAGGPPPASEGEVHVSLRPAALGAGMHLAPAASRRSCTVSLHPLG